MSGDGNPVLVNLVARGRELAQDPDLDELRALECVAWALEGGPVAPARQAIVAEVIAQAALAIQALGAPLQIHNHGDLWGIEYQGRVAYLGRAAVSAVEDAHRILSAELPGEDLH